MKYEFYVAWRGKGARSAFSVTQEAPVLEKNATKWIVDIIHGNPKILSPSAPPYYFPTGKPVANVPFSSPGFRYDNYLVEVGTEIGLIPPKNWEDTVEKWQRMRNALLDYSKTPQRRKD